MALGAYLAPSASGYKTVDPYFLSQGRSSLMLHQPSFSPNLIVEKVFPVWLDSLRTAYARTKVFCVDSITIEIDFWFGFHFFFLLRMPAGLFAGSPLFPGGGCPDIALGLGMGMSALRHCRRRKARTVFSDPQLTGLEKRFEAQR